MLTDAASTIADCAALVRAFSRERDWEQFHHPKDLGLALAIETGEALEHFRFLTNDEIWEAILFLYGDTGYRPRTFDEGSPEPAH